MPNDFRVRSLLWRGLALPRPAHGRRFLKKAPAVSVGFWGSALLVPTAKGPRLLQTPSNGNLGLYRFPLSTPACIEVAVFIEFYVENHSLEKNSYMYLLCWGCVACGGERAALWSQFFSSLWRSWGQTQCQSGLKAPLSAETPLYLFSVPHIAFPFVCPQVIIVLSELGRRVWAVRGLSAASTFWYELEVAPGWLLGFYSNVRSFKYFRLTLSPLWSYPWVSHFSRSPCIF